MKLEHKTRQRIIIGIAVALILYGILDRFLKFNIDQKTVSNVSMVLMIIAFMLLFGDRKKAAGPADKTAENTSANSIEQSAGTQDSYIEQNNIIEETEPGNQEMNTENTDKADNNAE